MNVLLLNHEFPPVGGGGGNATRHLCSELSQLGIRPTVLTGAFEGQPHLSSVDGAEVVRIPSLRKNRLQSTALELASFTVSASVSALRRGLTSRPEVVHAFFGLPSGAIAFGLKKTLGLPYLVSFRGRDVHGGQHASQNGITGPMKWMSRPVWRAADRLVANSTGLRDIANHVDPTVRVDVIPNGIDLRRFSPGEGIRTTVRVLFVGRLEPYKGLVDLLEAVRMLVESGQDGFSVAIVGQGSMDRDLRGMIDRMGIASHVEMKGQALPEEMPEIYRQADLFVLPSHVEGMSNVLLEAMASGLPVVATTIPGSQEVVHEGREGLLVEPSMPNQLCSALNGLIKDAEERERMGNAARENAEKRSWRGIAEAYIDIYQSILREAPACAASAAF